MRILIHSSRATCAGRRAENYIRHNLDSQHLELFPDLKSMLSEIRSRRFDIAVLILITATPREVAALLEIRSLLEGLPIVLLLHDQRDETYAAGFKLMPRFVEDLRNRGKDTCLVVKRIIENQQRSL